MKKTTKRILSAILAVCLLLAVMVPSVLAAGSALTISFSADDSQKVEIYLDGSAPSGEYAGLAANTQKEFSAWTYLNQSDPSRAIQVEKKGKYITVKFDKGDDTNGAWLAVGITAAAGTYDMTFYVNPGSVGGLTKVYVMPKAVYTAAIQGYTLGTSKESALTKEQNDAIYAALEGKTLAEGILNSNSNRTIAAEQSIGCAEFAESGEYVLLFRCWGEPEEATKENALRFIPKNLTLSPVFATVTAGETTTYCLSGAEVVNAINGAKEGTTIRLQDTVISNGSIQLAAGVTLDLNGNYLSVANVKSEAGAEVIDSSDGDTGVLKAANTDGWNLSNTNKEIPLFDSEAGGYRFYGLTDADKAAAAAVQAKIDGLTNVTLETETAVTEARAAYEALNALQKTLVDTAKLTAAEAKLVELKKAAEQAAADKAAADAVTAKIDAIGTVTLESDAAIKAARTAYEALTAAQKALVDTAKLTAAEAKLAELIKEAEKDAANKAAADAVTAKIEAIGTVTLESETAIQAARTAYEALTTVQKALVNTDKLTAAEAKLAELKKAAEEKTAADKAAADPVIAQIEAIGTVTLESEAAIQAARTAYDALTEDQKALVSNLSVLTAAEAKLVELKNPKTGDLAPVGAAACVLIASAGALSLVLVGDIRRKRV